MDHIFVRTVDFARDGFLSLIQNSISIIDCGELSAGCLKTNIALLVKNYQTVDV